MEPDRAFAAGVAVASASLLGFAALLAWVHSAAFGWTDDAGRFAVERIVAAPGGARRAVLYTGEGGGAAGWCVQRLLVEPAGAPAPTPERLLRVSYDSIAFRTNDCGSAVTLAWRGAAELEVGYTVGADGASTYQRAVTPDGAVRLRYATKTE